MGAMTWGARRRRGWRRSWRRSRGSWPSRRGSRWGRSGVRPRCGTAYGGHPQLRHPRGCRRGRAARRGRRATPRAAAWLRGRRGRAAGAASGCCGAGRTRPPRQPSPRLHRRRTTPRWRGHRAVPRATTAVAETPGPTWRDWGWCERRGGSCPRTQGGQRGGRPRAMRTGRTAPTQRQRAPAVARRPRPAPSRLGVRCGDRPGAHRPQSRGDRSLRQAQRPLPLPGRRPGAPRSRRRPPGCRRRRLPRRPLAIRSRRAEARGRGQAAVPLGLLRSRARVGLTWWRRRRPCRPAWRGGVALGQGVGLARPHPPARSTAARCMGRTATLLEDGATPAGAAAARLGWSGTALGPCADCCVF